MGSPSVKVGSPSQAWADPLVCVVSPVGEVGDGGALLGERRRRDPRGGVRGLHDGGVVDVVLVGNRPLEHPKSGARAGELRGLQLGDFDLYRKTITVLGKGSKRRLIPISSELVATVDEYLLTEYPLLGRTPSATDYLW